jgi:hypothetical protein
MSNAIEKNPAHLIESLDDEAKFQLLEHLAEEFGFDLTEQPEPVNPQSDILDVVEGVMRTLEKDIKVLKAQFAEGAELEYAVLDQVSDNIESAVSELLEAHENLNTLIDSEFDLDEEDDDEEDEE